MANQSAIHLHRVATIYSRLSPLFAHLRSDPSLAGNTLLPNAFSAIAPAMAFGDCGRLATGPARLRLREHEEWNSASAEIADAYQAYKNESGNALLWAGWNYWAPGKTDDAANQRAIQVVLTPDLVGSAQNLLDPSRILLRHAGTPLLTVADLMIPPVPTHPDEVPCGSGRSEDADLLPKDLLSTRRFLHNVWSQVFVPSVDAFRKRDQLTIVDHLMREHASHRTTPTNSLARDFAAFFGPPSSGAGHSKDKNIRTFACEPAWTELLWAAVERAVAARTASRDRNEAPEPPLRLLLDSWKDISKSASEMHALSVPLQALATALGPHVEPGPQAYVILQHLALFDRFCLSKYQYVFPVSFGKHLFVGFITVKEPLDEDQAAGWRQIVGALFGGLLVELLSNLYVDVRVRHDTLRWADEQRMILSHTLPKSVFKPAEYFAVKAHSEAARLAKKSTKLTREHTDNLQRCASTLIQLLQKGQAEIADYAQGQAAGLNHARPTNVYLVCKDIESRAQMIADFFVAGSIDRVARYGKTNTAARAAAAKGTTIRVKAPRKGPEPLVRVNRGLLAIHLWNVVDNAFRYADLITSGLLLEFDVISSDDSVRLVVTNNGRSIAKTRADLLNKLFSVQNPTDDSLRTIAEELQRGQAESSASFLDLESENRGVGLYRFNQYLISLWDGKPHTQRGSVTPMPSGTRFEFCFPLEAD